ncbi:MAG: hypothetical protein IT378_02885 [Sandaracinaceae bacterium]|nr:hypothetical protein [Sandaracinaceae bacterium]
MPDRRSVLPLGLALAAALALSFAITRLEPAPSSATSSAGPISPVSTEPGAARAPAARPRSSGPLRWIAAGGGGTPELNQVQLEQDLELAIETFAPSGPGLVLFAGGAGSASVQVLAQGRTPDPLVSELGELLAPRIGRGSRYRATHLAPDGPASAEAITSALEGALTDGDDPLTFFFGGHGEGGETPTDSHLALFGAHDLWVDDLAVLLDELGEHRTLRLVVASCFSGGFGEIAFDGADARRGPARTPRCGLFATTWDRESAGCDPNPDRAQQDGYSLHFLQGLRHRDRQGRWLPDEDIDFDRDGRVSLLEAHARARIAGRSFDVPTTTSERWLRHVAGEDPAVGADLPPPPWPEEQAVVGALEIELSLAGPLARERRERRARALAQLDEELTALGEEIELVTLELSAQLLHRWPALDDPWHPDYAAALGERTQIATFLSESPLRARWIELVREQGALHERRDALVLELAPLLRLERATTNLALAARVAADGGDAWHRYQDLLACERGRL